jgi:lipopolysaccharide export system protein LptC
MHATVTIATDRHAWQATRLADRRPAFRAAKRHSRRVRRLRVALPAALLAGLCLYAFSAWLNPWNALARLPNIKLNISGTKITMELPKIAGFTRDGRSYELTASAAAQDLKRPQFIELKEIRAKVELVDGTMVTVAGSTGLYDTKSEVITLTNDVVVTTSSGTEVRLREARLDARKGHIVSDKAVEVLMPSGRIDAKQLEVIDAGEVIQFGGGVTMVLNAEGGPATAAAGSRR